MTTVVMETSLGKIEIELDGEKAPKTTKNFLQYVDDKFYDGTIFHRVISGFMVQGGGMKEDMSEKKTREPIPNEADNGLKNLKGTIAMARTSDPNSASAQFFINLQTNEFQDHKGKTPQGWGYAVFGKVTSGMDIVEKMVGIPTGSHGMHQDVPKVPIVIKSVTRK
ncbi:MAG: peptidylprolyl isomerase [Bdellovibrionales bacterium]